MLTVYGNIRILYTALRGELSTRIQKLEALSKRALTRNSRAYAAYKLAHLFQESGDYRKCVDYMEAARTLGWPERIIDLESAPVYFRLGKHQRAWELVSRRLEETYITPEEKAFGVLAAYACGSGKSGQKTLNKLLREHPRKGARLAYLAAVRLEWMMKHLEALEIYRVLVLTKVRTEALKGMLRAYLNVHDWEGVQEVLEDLSMTCQDEEAVFLIEKARKMCRTGRKE